MVYSQHPDMLSVSHQFCSWLREGIPEETSPLSHLLQTLAYCLLFPVASLLDLGVPSLRVDSEPSVPLLLLLLKTHIGHLPEAHMVHHCVPQVYHCRDRAGLTGEALETESPEHLSQLLWGC